MSGLKNYRELDAWQCAMRLVEIVYVLSDELPNEERYGLISQMQRAAISIPTNIAEGQARGTVGFGLSFLRIAIGSAAELGTLVELARRLRYVTSERTRELDQLHERVQQMLYGMRRDHRRRIAGTGATVLSILALLLTTSLA